MRAYVPEYDLVAPAALSDVLALVADHRRPIAGGTDLMVLFEAGKLVPRRLVSLHALAELRGIVTGAGHVTIGALATYTEMQRNETLRLEFPLLVRAAGWTVRGWPVHSVDWKREILRSVVDEDCWANGEDREVD